MMLPATFAMAVAMRPPSPGVFQPVAARLAAAASAGVAHRRAPQAKPQPTTVPEMIRAVFGDDADVALRVATCESHLRPDAVNPSGATGVFQIMRQSHSWRVQEVGGTSLLDPMTNTKVAHHIVKHHGWSPWVCARMLGITSRRLAPSDRPVLANRSRSTSTSRGPRTPRRPQMSA